jgi:SAM-dependent methyltransferase
MTERIVEPEWLDELPAENPGALASRRDLRRLNWLMNHAGIIARVLRRFSPPKRILDLGAGDGAFTLRVATAARWRSVEVILVDRTAAVDTHVREGFRALDCHVSAVQCDVLDGLDNAGAADCIITNLFLHHFDRTALPRLLAHVAAHGKLCIACEPCRSGFALLASRLVGLVGCNAVTRHDAVASVRAGFRDREISQHWPAGKEWFLEERPAGLFSHLFVARRS